MHLAGPSIAAGVSLVAAGVIGVIPAAPSLPDIGIPSVQLTAGEGTLDTLADLLNSAQTNLTDGINILSENVPDHVDLAQQLSLQVTSLDILGHLQSAEDTISAHDGFLADLINQFWFTPLNQEWDTTTDAVLSGDQALVEAATSGSGLVAAELAIAGPNFELAGDALAALPVEYLALFF